MSEISSCLIVRPVQAVMAANTEVTNKKETVPHDGGGRTTGETERERDRCVFVSK